MAVQKLPYYIQSLLCAATQKYTYRSAIEELVYNAIDAQSTSVAIRVNIDENKLQVFDNGEGITKNDYALLGLRHATSKCVDFSTLKSAPDTYGYRGQSLANLIEMSEMVQISSQRQNSDETWIKTFYKGKEQSFSKTSQRASKGTTIQISGYLYNLTIQKRNIDVLNELDEIKRFLEQLSLVHNNISISLRNDAKNEIIFKAHKNRDIYQTLSTFFEIREEDLLELKVEKNNYKVVAYLGKKDRDIQVKHWVFLNRKIIQNSKIHELLNENLIRSLKLRLQNRKRKFRNVADQDDIKSLNDIPCYFILLSCPYYDYDMSYTNKQTVVEFKKWEPVTKLIEKLVQFYAGESITTTTHHLSNVNQKLQTTEDTRDKVGKIMNKILGSHPKKLGVSQMQNGLKGKPIKRKSTKKLNNLLLSNILSKKSDNKKVINNDKGEFIANVNQDAKNKKVEIIKNAQTNRNQYEIKKTTDEDKDKIKPKKKNSNRNKGKKCKEVPIKANLPTKAYKPLISKKCATLLKTRKWDPKPRSDYNKEKVQNRTLSTKQCKQKISKKGFKIKGKNQIEQKINTVLQHFKQDPTGSVKKRCNMLADKVEDLMSFKNKRKRKIFVNERIQQNNITRTNKKYSIQKKTGEIVIHDYIPMPPLYVAGVCDKNDEKKVIKTYNKTSYDLIRTVLRTQEITEDYIAGLNETISDNQSVQTYDLGSYHYNKAAPLALANTELDQTQQTHVLSKLTFKRHNYDINEDNHSSHIHGTDNEKNKDRLRMIQFISTKSKENFLVPTEYTKQNYKNKLKKPVFTKLQKPYARYRNENRILDTNYLNCESSYTIEFTDCNDNDKIPEGFTEFTKPGLNLNDTFTVEDDQESSFIEDRNIICPEQCCTIDLNFNNIKDSYTQETYTIIERSRETNMLQDTHSVNPSINNDANHNFQKDMNVIFISKSQDANFEVSANESDINPVNFCETVQSKDVFEENCDSWKLKNESLFNDEFEIDSFLCDRNIYTQTITNNKNTKFETAHEMKKNITSENRDGYDYDLDLNDINSKKPFTEENRISTSHRIEKVNLPKQYSNVFQCNNADKCNHVSFNFHNRPRFMPKGMSPIIANRRSNTELVVDLAKAYYKETIYHKFARTIENNTEVFVPEVQNMKRVATNAIEKVNNKLDKDNASLTFNSESLREAKVLGQVDSKFIAAKIKGKTPHSSKESEFLVLFDQHAVHERIRLENNLSDYFTGDNWKSIVVNDVTLKFNNNEILYLHNYKDKFTQLGLQWTILSNYEVSINAIPEAILGKNPRQPEIVIKAVKNLISEEVNTIQSQSGCISLYPRTVMDLIFSEACRYAIKFGDRLSHKECTDLLTSLSQCKTPFQCAHGRPVMAVLMCLEANNYLLKYKINSSKVYKWLKCYK